MLRNKKILTLLAVLVGLTLGLVGCGKISPTAPEEPALLTPSQQPPGSQLPTEALWPKMTADQEPVLVKARIYRNSKNFVELPLPGECHQFVIKKRAVKQDTTITIGIARYAYWNEKEGQWLYTGHFDFGPDGLKFRKKAELVLDPTWLGLNSGERVVLRYFNEHTALWEEVTSKQVRDGKPVKFKIEHFSKYAISR